MTVREKVIERLERVSYYFKSLLAVGWQGDSDIYREHMESVKMALTMLKMQEPRVLTLEAIQNDCPDYIYIETASGWIECCIKDEGMSNKFVGYFVCGFGECFIEEWSEYGKTWRCWSYLPTDEQRKMVKWND